MSGNLLTVAQLLFAAIERGDREALLRLYAEDAVQIEYPNRLKSKGDRRPPSAMAADLAKGKAILRKERYTVVNAVEAADALALQVAWEGVLAVPIGALKPGDTMRTFSGMFLKFRDGKIVEQHNYDCFEDFTTPKG